MSYRARKKLRPDKSQRMGRCAVWSPAAECRLFFLLRRWPTLLIPPAASDQTSVRDPKRSFMEIFTAVTGKVHSRIFFKLGTQRSSVISFCFPHSSADVLFFIHTTERPLCFDAPNCTFEFYMSSVGDLKIIPIREFKSALFVQKKKSVGLVVAWPSSDQPRCQ